MNTIDQIDSIITSALSDLESVHDADGLEQYRIKYLGTKGAVKNLTTLLAQVPREHKPALGQKINTAKAQVTAAFEARKVVLGSQVSATGPLEDVTLPGAQPQLGNRHILMKVADELTDLFARMGFTVAQGPELEDEFHNFIALNIPPSHPARDPLDNFYITSGVDHQGQQPAQEQQLLLRTQTSTVQIRVMQSQKPPIRVVIPGRVYRPDTHDDTHLSQFHQLEALVVDQNVTMVDLKSTVLQFVKAYFGAQTQVRFRPSFFPFTEPSAECDVWFPEKQQWIELGGCGMVHPNVLQACGIDPQVYTGWAFGFGIERIAMRKYGINNIRLFVENDVRFLRQF
ncbi:MAG: phenylalanine--tRNA ligase subunit alpha [Phycisphaerales bacterium]|nr:phenylalanine--tRNA ligase subunit alpha [Phycisphaerales bacterium]